MKHKCIQCFSVLVKLYLRIYYNLISIKRKIIHNNLLIKNECMNYSFIDKNTIYSCIGLYYVVIIISSGKIN